jgi:carbonic anhydrase
LRQSRQIILQECSCTAPSTIADDSFYHPGDNLEGLKIIKHPRWEARKEVSTMNRIGLLMVLVWGCLLGEASIAEAQIQAMATGDFAYTGDKGPGFWSEISALCGPSSGRHQSPIDIDDVVLDPKLEPLHIVSTSSVTELTNPGYTIVATPSNRATVAIDGVTYTLIQFHFHALSEHTILGQHGVMELHAVFGDPTGTKLAVIGVIYKIGRPNRFLQRMLGRGLPQKTNSPAVTVEGLNLEDAFTDTTRYFSYAGSLTTPPCSENVSWFVLERWAELSEKQYEEFRNVLGNDFRPLQPRNGRTVHASIGR